MMEDSKHINQGIQESKSNDYHAALKSFSKAIEANSNSKIAYLNHGALCNQSGLFDAAIEDFSAVIDLDPWDIPAYFNRFLSHFAKLDYKSALKDLYIAVSLSYTREGQILNKIQSFDTAVRMVPNNAKALLGRAKLQRVGGNYSLSQDDINESIKYCPKYKDAFAERAALHRRMKNNAKCQQDIDKALQLTKSSNICQIDLVPITVSNDQQLIDSELRQRYRQFMQLRGIIYSKNERISRHLRVMNNFSDVHKMTQRQYSQTNPNNMSYSNLSKVQSALNKLRKNVNIDKEQLNNSMNESVGKRSRSQQSNSSVQRRKFAFTSGKTKFGNILDGADLNDDQRKKQDDQNKKKLNLTSRQDTFEQSQVQVQDETRSVDNEKVQGSSKKRSNIKKTSNKMKTQPEESKKLVIQIFDAILTKNTQMIGSMSPYCLMKYGRNNNRTQVDKGTKPKWNQKFTFDYKSSRGLITLQVMDKQSFKSDDFIGEAIVSIVDGSTKADLKNGEQKVGTISYKIIIE